MLLNDEAEDLIETLWNVKLFYFCVPLFDDLDLIETLWNVKKTGIVSK